MAETHPEIATQLKECLAKLDSLHAAAVGIEESAGVVRVNLNSSVAFRQLGDYHIQSELGRGGMGVVYEAEQITLGRRVAIKTLPLTSLLDERQIARFKNESIAAASLNHPHIVPIYDVGCEMGIHYYAMQCIDGGSLADVIAARHAKNDVRSTDETRAVLDTTTLLMATADEFYRSVAEAGRQAAEALQHAHERGILHRDVKPSNLMVDSQGHIWVTDFGLAAMQSDMTLTRSGELIGTLRYLSPEQAGGDRPVDHRTDIYGLGVTLYELLTGQPAQVEVERGQLLRDVIEKQPPPIRQFDSKIPKDLETVISKAMSKDYAQRYLTAGELANDLTRFLSRKPVLARRPNHVRKTISWIRRNHTVSVLTSLIICLLAVAAIGGATYALQLSKQQRELKISLYARDIALAQQLIARGERTRAEATLLKWTTTPEQQAALDYEWLYLWRQCQQNASDTVLRTPADAHDVIVLDKHRIIATSAFGTTIPIWDAQTYDLLDERAIVTQHQSEITRLAVDPDQQVVASGGAAGLVCLWRIEDGELIDSFEIDGMSHGTGIADMRFLT